MISCSGWSLRNYCRNRGSTQLPPARTSELYHNETQQNHNFQVNDEVNHRAAPASYRKRFLPIRCGLRQPVVQMSNIDFLSCPCRPANQQPNVRVSRRTLRVLYASSAHKAPASAYSYLAPHSPCHFGTQRMPITPHLTAFMALPAAQNSVAVHETFANFLRLYERGRR